MGCDIHAHLEIKRIPFGSKSNILEWVYIGQPKIHQWYDAFRAIGVQYRGDGEILFPAKGLPIDVTKITKTESRLWDDDGHTFSNLTLQEIMIHEDKDVLSDIFNAMNCLEDIYQMKT